MTSWNVAGRRQVDRIAAFISIPKNASKTVLRILDLGPNRDEETTDSLVIYENHQRGVVLNSKYKLDDLFVFCFSRNPYSRSVSWYEFHRDLEPYKSLTFEAWVRQGMPHHWKQQNQTDYVKEGISPLLQYNFVDGCRVDFVGRIESFESDLRNVIARLNSICGERSIAHKFQYAQMAVHRYRRQRARLADYYSDGTRQIVYSLLEKDFIHFGYDE